jgi:peptidoglycan LD-endopeptidase LytH
MRRSLVLAGALLGAVGMIALPLGAVAQDLDGARDRVDRLQDDLREVSERYEEIIAATEELRAELAELDREEARLLERAEDIDTRLSLRARQVFMRGAGSELELILAAEGPNVGVERASFVAAIQGRETADLEDAIAVRARLEQTRELQQERERQLETYTDELAELRDRLEGDLEAAERQVASLEALASRQRAIDQGGQQGRYACPLDPGVTHFVDSWGAPRSGGRSHQGTDIMGPMGARVYAFTDGVISRHSNSRLGGISLYLRGDDGQVYFYTHLQGYAPAGAVGTRVRAGDHIAYNGNTGNARGGPPHIHFERHPGGGSAVNPYPWLARACF